MSHNSVTIIGLVCLRQYYKDSDALNVPEIKVLYDADCFENSCSGVSMKGLQVKKRILLFAVAASPMLVAVDDCGGSEKGNWEYESCGSYSLGTSDILGYGNCPDSTASSGSLCECSRNHTDNDSVYLYDPDAGGINNGDRVEPKAHAVSLGSVFTSPPKNPTSGSSGSSFGDWDWYSKLRGVPNTPEDYSGTWTTYLSIVDSEGNTISGSCSDNYNAGYHYEWDEPSYMMGGSGWASPTGGPWSGDVSLFTHPGQVFRDDGSVKSYLMLKDGNPLINGVTINSFTVVDAGSATGIYIDDVFYDLASGSPTLSASFGFDSTFFVEYDSTVSEKFPPVLAVTGSLPSSTPSAAPTSGYEIPTWLSYAVTGLDQPLIVRIGSGSSHDSIMLSAVGSGMTRGTKLDNAGRFSRTSSVDGWSVSGRVVSAGSTSLDIRDFEVSRWGVPLPVPRDHILSSVP